MPARIGRSFPAMLARPITATPVVYRPHNADIAVEVDLTAGGVVDRRAGADLAITVTLDAARFGDNYGDANPTTATVTRTAAGVRGFLLDANDTTATVARPAAGRTGVSKGATTTTATVSCTAAARYGATAGASRSVTVGRTAAGALGSFSGASTTASVARTAAGVIGEIVGIPDGTDVTFNAPADEMEQLRQELLYGDLMTAAEAAEELAERDSAVNQLWTISVCDKWWVKIGELGDDVIELQGADPRNKSSSAQLKIKGDSWLIDAFMSCQTTMVGVLVETGGLRFAFYVDTFDYEFEDGAWVGTASLNGIYDILNYIVIWPQWFMPLQVQILSHAIYIGGLCMCIEAMVMENSLRLQAGLWEFVNNALSLNSDMRAWFGTLLQSNGNIFQMLKTPIYVVRTNPFLDTSPLIARTVRMETCGAVIEDITRAYGVTVEVSLWLPGDDQPDYWTQNFDFMRLTQPTYVVTVKDRSQITGPTGTIIDSAVRQVVDVAGSFFAGMLPVIQNVPGRDGVFVSEQLGVHYVGPWAMLIAPEPGEKGNVVTCRLSFHTPKGWQHIIGGRSPKWLNDLMNATFSWMIDAISILIGFTGIPSSLLEGFLNNTLLAFQLLENYNRRDEVGPYHPGIEVFHPTSSAPYNIETVFGFINAMWDSRGWVSAIVTFRNGEVYTLGRDVFKGGLVSVLYMERTRIFTDYIEEVQFRLDRTHRDILLQIGDGKAEESPLAKHQRFITGILESINVALLTPQSSGLA